MILFSVVTVGLEPTSVRSMVARSPWSGLRSPFRANKLRSLAFGTPHWGDASFVCPVDVSHRCVRWYEFQADITQKQDHREGDPVLRGDSWTRTNDPIDVNDVL